MEVGAAPTSGTSEQRGETCLEEAKSTLVSTSLYITSLLKRMVLYVSHNISVKHGVIEVM